MVAFTGNMKPPLLPFEYLDQNPNFPPQQTLLPLGQRGLIHARTYQLGDFENQQPTSALPRDVVGWEWQSFFHDYYNRVWMIPSTVDFGPITANSTSLVYLWNAHLDAITLETIDFPDDSSLSLTGIDTPLTINALGGTYYGVVASIEGQPTINAEFTFTFSPTEVVRLPVLGIRARLWPWGPNWDAQFDVTYEFRTEIITSDNGKEQRIAQRQTPRKEMSFESHVNQLQFQRFSRQMAVWQGRSTIVPEFSKYVRLAEPAMEGDVAIVVDEVYDWISPGTNLVFIEGTRTMLRTVDTIVGNVLTLLSQVDSEWRADAKGFKGLSGRLNNEMSGTQYTNQLLAIDVGFSADPGVEVYGDPGEPEIVFDGREVFLKRPNWKDRLNPSFQSYLLEVDYGVGRVDYFTPITYSDKFHKANYVGFSIEDTAAVERFFFRQRGQQGEFFMPTFTDDIPLKQTVPALTANLRVEGVEFSRDMALDTIYRSLIIFKNDGTYIMGKVQTIYEIDDTYGNDSIIQLTVPLESELNPSDIRQICWMPLWRLASDSMTFTYVTDEVAQFAMTMKTLEYEAAE